MTDRRARLLFVTLSCARLEWSLSPALDALHAWLDSWSGMGVIERGMARQGYDLQLTRYANERWRATFFLTGREHSMTQATGSVWEPTPWRAVQGAAWEALRRLDAGALTPHSSSPVVGSVWLSGYEHRSNDLRVGGPPLRRGGAGRRRVRK